MRGEAHKDADDSASDAAGFSAWLIMLLSLSDDLRYVARTGWYDADHEEAIVQVVEANSSLGHDSSSELAARMRIVFNLPLRFGGFTFLLELLSFKAGNWATFSCFFCSLAVSPARFRCFALFHPSSSTR